MIQYASSIGGEEQGEYMSVEECNMKCIKKYPACVAVDYVPRNRVCYHHARKTSQPLLWNGCVNRYNIYCGGCGYGRFLTYLLTYLLLVDGGINGKWLEIL